MESELPSYFRGVSVVINEILDLVGYSQSDRQRKLEFNTVNEVIGNLFSSSLTVYLFGSKSDGSTFHDMLSDLDILLQVNKYNAVVDLSECVREKVNFLMVQDDDTHPGYVKLEYVDVTRPHHAVPVRNCILKDSVLDGNHRTVFPNTLLKSRLIIPGKEEINGPAKTEIIGGGNFPSTDRVLAVRCYGWPAEGKCFLTRRRWHGWPTAKQLHRFRTYGCFLVTIGHPFSSEPHLEWRLSYAIAERDLTRSLNDTMMKVFLLLKIIKTTFIKPVIGDTLCSFHCKVCIFWVRERTCAAIWKQENILLCLSLCLKQLLDWAKSGYCPDFFNERNNIYDRKVIGTVREELVRILETILYNKLEHLLFIKIGNIGQLLSLRISCRYLPIQLPTFLEVADDYNSLYGSYKTLHANICKLQQNGHMYIYWKIISVLSVARNYTSIIRDALNCALPAMYANLTYQLCSLFIAEKYYMNSQKRSLILEMMSMCIVRGLDCDSVSCRLKLAGFFYQLGRLDFTEICLRWVCDRFNDDILIWPLISNVGKIVETSLTTISSIFSQKIDFKTFFKDYVALSVVYIPSEIRVIPSPLRAEVFKALFVPEEIIITTISTCNQDRVQVDPHIFTHFLLYMCHDRQGLKTSKHIDIRNLMYVLKTDLNKERRETSFNLLGYCLMKEGQFAEAYACFIKSLSIRPHVNASKFWMAILFQKMYNIFSLHHRII
ncbi:hypothetical protein ACJMK2_007862 [Sinanodonta woodiana]|uniref:Mab-21-like HhH/H2TH-like domain-containing protein n=1 Tax=Sinanodonta woodiana TaxID=1069815 RepID=A0ABD3VMA8_SINWO